MESKWTPIISLKKPKKENNGECIIVLKEGRVSDSCKQHCELCQ
jgi:hypothetical protein